MDVRQLEAFLAVAEHLHFGRAADQLFVAPSPLGRTIRSLESDLGVRLFDRNTRKVSLTEAGRALVVPAREALQAVRRAVDTVDAAVNGEVGVLRVEFASFGSYPFVAALAREMQRIHPGVRIELSSQSISRPAMQNLVDDRTDIALGRWDQLLPPGISTRVLAEDSLVVALPSTHRLAGARVVTFAQVASEPFVSLPYPAGALTTDRLLRLGYAYEITIDNMQFAPDTQSCIALVSAQVGCHLTLASVREWTADPNVVFVDLAPEDAAQVPDVHLRVAWRMLSPPTAVRIALELLDRVVAGGDSTDDHVAGAQGHGKVMN